MLRTKYKAQEKYPQASDIKKHKDSLFTSLVQHFAGFQTIESVQQDLRALMGDAALVSAGLKLRTKFDMEAAKQEIMNMSLIVTNDYTHGTCNDCGKEKLLRHYPGEGGNELLCDDCRVGRLY